MEAMGKVLTAGVWGMGVALMAEATEVVVVLVAEAVAKGCRVAARGRPGVPPHLAVRMVRAGTETGETE